MVAGIKTIGILNDGYIALDLSIALTKQMLQNLQQ